MHAVVIVAHPGVMLLNVAGPAEVFAGANLLLSHEAYRVRVVSPDGRPVRASCGVQLAVDGAVGKVDRADTMLVCGGFDVGAAMADRKLVTGVAGIAATAGRVGSVCTGTFTLGAAGLLDGRTVTTHWAFAPELARRFPAADVEPDRIFVDDERVVTSAGVTAAMDLTLALVASDHGAELARTLARYLVLLLQRPGNQSQFSERLAAPVGADSPVRALVDAIVADPAADHRAAALAARASVSERHLGRLFAAETGTTPQRFVERVRIEAARHLLEQGDLPLKTVATRAGFGRTETMRKAFLRAMDVTPAEYRRRFRA